MVGFDAGLALRVAGKKVKKPCILEAGELLLDREQFDGLPWKSQIQALIDEAVTAKWFLGNAVVALEQLLTHSVSHGDPLLAHRRHIAADGTNDEKVRPARAQTVNKSV